MSKKPERGRGRAKPPQRVTTDISSIAEKMADYPDLEGADIDWDAWETMTPPQRLLYLAKKGIRAAEEALDESE